MMVMANVIGALLMQDAGDGKPVPVVVLVLAVGSGMVAVNGALIVLTRMPDIVATLAMVYVWQGGVQGGVVDPERPGCRR